MRDVRKSSGAVRSATCIDRVVAHGEKCVAFFVLIRALIHTFRAGGGNVALLAGPSYASGGCPSTTSESRVFGDIATGQRCLTHAIDCQNERRGSKRPFASCSPPACAFLLHRPALNEGLG